MRGLAYVFAGYFLILLQGNYERLLLPLGDLLLYFSQLNWPGLSWLSHEGMRLLHGTTPSLVLPMVLYLGIHEASMVRGAFLSFCLGWGLDVLGGGPAFLFAFTQVAIWGLSRTVATRVSAHNAVTRIPLTLLFGLIEGVMVLTLLAIFGTDSRRPLELMPLVLPRAVMTALLSPPVFSLAQRLNVDYQGKAVQASRSSASTD